MSCAKAYGSEDRYDRSIDSLHLVQPGGSPALGTPGGPRVARENWAAVRATRGVECLKLERAVLEQQLGIRGQVYTFHKNSHGMQDVREENRKNQDLNRQFHPAIGRNRQSASPLEGVPKQKGSCNYSTRWLSSRCFTMTGTNSVTAPCLEPSTLTCDRRDHTGFLLPMANRLVATVK